MRLSRYGLGSENIAPRRLKPDRTKLRRNSAPLVAEIPSNSQGHDRQAGADAEDPADHVGGDPLACFSGADFFSHAAKTPRRRTLFRRKRGSLPPRPTE